MQSLEGIKHEKQGQRRGCLSGGIREASERVGVKAFRAEGSCALRE